MTLYDLLVASDKDFDTYDDVYDAVVTVAINLDAVDDYDEFCIALVKLITVKSIARDKNPICDWSDFIKRNMDVFRSFADNYWYKNNTDDEDDFICEWMKEFHLLLAGHGGCDDYGFYKQELVDKCH